MSINIELKCDRCGTCVAGVEPVGGTVADRLWRLFSIAKEYGWWCDRDHYCPNCVAWRVPDGQQKAMAPGAPCSHPGCLSHVSHPCEGCGRVGGVVSANKGPRDAVRQIADILEGWL